MTQVNQAPVAPKLINHVIFALDASPSMTPHAGKVEGVFANLLSAMSSNPDQETRVSVYTFAEHTRINQLYFDTLAKDVGKVDLNIQRYGATALIDAGIKTIQDHIMLQANAAGKKDEDHSFLLYVLTDGEDNNSTQRPQALSALINGLNDMWTVATMVPNMTGVHYAKMCGFPTGNIEVWKVDSATGFEEAGFRMQDSFKAYASGRSMGVKSTKSLFNVDVRNLTTEAVKQNLTEITGGIYTVSAEAQIKDFAELVTKQKYVKGSAFYELARRETLQAKKEIVIVSKTDGRKYGGAAARSLLGLPNVETDVSPGDFGSWRIFVQSTSFNRKVAPGTNVFIK